MNAHMATRLIRSAIALLACAPSRDPLFVPRKYSEKDASMKARFSKEEVQEKIETGTRLLDADPDVTVILDKCEERRSRQRPLPNSVSWDNLLRLDGEIINPTPVVGDRVVAPIAYVSVTSAPN